MVLGMASEILINVRPNTTRVAYLEKGVLRDLKLEQKTSPTLVGSIFKGKVVRVLPGMQAAFVDIGLDRAAFLYVGDIRTPAVREKALLEDEESHQHHSGDEDENEHDHDVDDVAKPSIQDLLKEGQQLMVQVAKDPLGTKGARITTHISLAGRHVVYMPTVEHLGISRKIESEEERERLRKEVEALKPQGGVIVRTAGEGAKTESLRKDLDYLNRLWTEVQKNYEKRKSTGLVHSELDVELRALRDLLSEDVSKIIVDEPKAHKRILNFLTQFMPNYKQLLYLHDKPEPLFDLYNLDLEISRALDRKIWLKSGGYIVIDEAEALVVIDVNTGRYVGKKDLEDTILKTNLEATKEIAYQLRVRNCGGIIIIDFIDMEKAAHREKVLEQLKLELGPDIARTEIGSMSTLGLVEMTRKRIRPSLHSSLCEPCPYCEGDGVVKRKNTVSHEIFRELEREAIRTPGKAPLAVSCHSKVADWIYAEESETLDFVEQKINRPIVFKIEPTYHIEQFEISIVKTQ